MMRKRRIKKPLDAMVLQISLEQAEKREFQVILGAFQSAKMYDAPLFIFFDVPEEADSVWAIPSIRGFMRSFLENHLAEFLSADIRLSERGYFEYFGNLFWIAVAFDLISPEGRYRFDDVSKSIEELINSSMDLLKSPTMILLRTIAKQENSDVMICGEAKA